LVAYIPTVLVGGIAVVMHFLHPERKRATLPRTEEVMTTLECITVFFSQVATHRQTIPNHPHATFVEPPCAAYLTSGQATRKRMRPVQHRI